MVADPINSAVAGYTMGELLYSVPNAFGLRRWVENLSTCLLDEPVRIAMMYYVFRKPFLHLVI